jgi:hypothetical protein
MLFQLALCQPGSEVGAINRNVEPLEDVRKRTHMIFVTVRENDGSDIVAILLEKREVGDADVNPIGSLFREAHAGVENEHLIAVAHSHTIHSKLADTAERNNLEDTTHFMVLLSGETPRPLVDSRHEVESSRKV